MGGEGPIRGADAPVPQVSDALDGELALPSLLLVEDADGSGAPLRRLLEGRYGLSVVVDARQVLRHLQGHYADVVLLRLDSSERLTEGFDLLGTLRDEYPEIPVLLLSSRPEAATLVRAMRLGVVGYVNTDAGEAELELNLKTALELRASRGRLRVRGEGEEASIVGNSPAMATLRQDLGRLARLDRTLLISGEPGTGKSLCARALHALGARPDAPFVAVNCAAFPPAGLERELFGHERDAFDGAQRRRIGRLQEAAEGTLYLEEIARMSLETQQKLLRTLSTRRFRPLGSRLELPLRARVLLGSSRDLVREAREGRFLGPLLLRLRGLELKIPPLRDRLEDVEPLAHHLIFHKARAMKLAVPVLEAAALRRLQRQSWPGNVRELGTVIENALVHLQGPRLGPKDLRLLEDGSYEGMSYREAKALALETFMRAYYKHLLEVTHGSMPEMTAASRLPRQTVYRHLRDLGLDREDFRRH